MEQQIIDLLQSDDERNIKIGILLAKTHGYTNIKIYDNLKHYNDSITITPIGEYKFYKFNTQDAVVFIIRKQGISERLKSETIINKDMDRDFSRVYNEFINYFIDELILKDGTTTN